MAGHKFGKSMAVSWHVTAASLFHFIQSVIDIIARCDGKY